jgi:hypothetical protein
MIKFKMVDEDGKKEFSIKLSFQSVEEFDDYSDDDQDYEDFLSDMENGSADYCGTLIPIDGVDEDGTEWIGYTSLEVENFEKATEKFKRFFEKDDLVLED